MTFSLPSEKRDKEIVELAKKGESYTQIAKRYSITRGRVSQICVKAGFVRRPFDVNPENIGNEAVREYIKNLKGNK